MNSANPGLTSNTFLKLGRWKAIPALFLLLLTQFALSQGWLPLVSFLIAGLGIIPIALLLSESTEEIAEHSGSTIGAILTALFGNCAEFIIALTALRKGLVDVVKASITGAILSDLLLVTGLAMLIGGLRYSEQSFQPTMMRTNGAAMTLAVIALALPASLISTSGIDNPQDIHGLSITVAAILIAIYLLTLVFSLATHNHLFDPPIIIDKDNENVEAETSSWKTLRPWLIQLVVSTVALAYQSEQFVVALEPATEQLGLSALFTGVIIIPIIGGFSEYLPAARGALNNRMDLSLSLAMGSSLLVALFMAPVLVIIANFIGQPMDLDFASFEVIALGFSVFIVNLVGMDAKSNWLEGVLLLGTYTIFGAAFYYYPS
ncbi:calcium/proton exchanger [Synechococcus sp. W2B2]|uniref:calcium/proton exchanger n=1 Tax=unclassified Synechococcus TaxID=2626047 RepID=UPI0002FA5F2A|nr:calcium/proton exchanger [Synechococcus sp. WH 7805]